MKIVKIGTFDERGMPTGWIIADNPNSTGSSYYALGIIDDTVRVNGVEIVEWTKKRKDSMITL